MMEAMEIGLGLTLGLAVIILALLAASWPHMSGRRPKPWFPEPAESHQTTDAFFAGDDAPPH